MINLIAYIKACANTAISGGVVDAIPSRSAPVCR